MTAGVVAAVVGFLVGSLPVGYLMVRVRADADIREVGSGNIGATNVSRILGTRAALVTLVLDALKGVAGVLLGGLIAGPIGAATGAGGAVAGHCFTPWLGGRGGKGVATTIGAFAVLSPAALAVAVGILALLAWLTRYVSLGSLVGSVTLVVMVAALGAPGEVVVAALVVASIIWVRHVGNIRRLLRGTENQWGRER